MGRRTACAGVHGNRPAQSVPARCCTRSRTCGSVEIGEPIDGAHRLGNPIDLTELQQALASWLDAAQNGANARRVTHAA